MVTDICIWKLRYISHTNLYFKFAERAVASQAPCPGNLNSVSASNDKKSYNSRGFNNSNRGNGYNDPEDVRKRSEKFKETFLARIQTLRNQPFAHGNLTVRSLLDMREHCLSEFDFHDPYLKQKRLENDQVMASYYNLDQSKYSTSVIIP